MFGITFKSDLEKLFEVNSSERNNEWIARFSKLFEKSEMFYESLDPFYGPDGLPYINLLTKKTKNTTSLDKIANKCLDYGLGIVLSPKPNTEPYWIFSCGDLVSYKNLGSIYFADGFEGHEEYVVKNTEKVYISNPTEHFLPTSIRNILREDFINVFKIEHPRVYLMRNPNMKPEYSMVFNISKKDFNENNDHYIQAMMRISWHLPKICPATAIMNSQIEYYDL